MIQIPVVFCPTIMKATYQHKMMVNKDEWKNESISVKVGINNLAIYSIHICNYVHVFFFPLYFEKKQPAIDDHIEVGFRWQPASIESTLL
jgi:hypothetical protein